MDATTWLLMIEKSEDTVRGLYEQLQSHLSECPWGLCSVSGPADDCVSGRVLDEAWSCGELTLAGLRGGI